jgi:oxygen-dependent protoporphyrinogen oxidase
MSDTTRTSGHVVVVGGGIAGAAAANRLQHSGFDVTVLESASHIGGRTSTLRRDGYAIDLAATMLLSSYHRTVELIAEENWHQHFTSANDLIGVERDGRIHHIRASQPLTALTTPLLSPRAKLHLARVAADVIKHRKQLDWEDPMAVTDLHYGDVRAYADTRVRSDEVRDYLIDPACRFLGLSDLTETATVDFFLLAKNMGKTALFNSPAGIDTLAHLLTSNVKVETDTEVVAVEENSTQVTVTYTRDGASSQITADACVIAVPAPIAARLYPQMGSARADFLNSTVYAPALNVYFGVDTPPVEPSALILLPQKDFPDLACVILDHNKATGRTPQGKGLISAYWQNHWANAHWDDSDESIAQHTADEVNRLLPHSVNRPDVVVVNRWKHALITGPVSRYRDLERFRAMTPPDSRVRFAGDAVSSSTMNSCLCSGERAAREVIRAIKR